MGTRIGQQRAGQLLTAYLYTPEEAGEQSPHNQQANEHSHNTCVYTV